MVEMLQYKKIQFGKDRKRMSYFDQQHWNGGGNVGRLSGGIFGHSLIGWGGDNDLEE